MPTPQKYLLNFTSITFMLAGLSACVRPDPDRAVAMIIDNSLDQCDREAKFTGRGEIEACKTGVEIAAKRYINDGYSASLSAILTNADGIMADAKHGAKDTCDQSYRSEFTLVTACDIGVSIAFDTVMKLAAASNSSSSSSNNR